MNRLFSYLKTFGGDLFRSFIDLSIVIGVVVVFQFLVLRSVPESWPTIAIGLLIVAVGLALFLRGLENGIFPIGEELAEGLAKHSHIAWVILFAFIIGFSTTIAEPALIAVADKAAVISGGAIDALILRIVVALSVGFAIVLGVTRIFLNHPIHWYIISGYVAVIGITFFAPPEIVGLAFDSGGVTTSTVTVPLIAALGIGLATTLKGRNPVIDGFGLIAFASLTPMIFVQLYGIIAYSFYDGVGHIAQTTISNTPSTFFENVTVYDFLIRFVGTIGDVLPVIITILFFTLFVVRKRIQKWGEKAFGFFLVILGLYAFVIGLEIGLFPIGEAVAKALAESANILLIYTFAFTIGFATTIAEPALTAIARKAEEISGGAIKQLALRIFVALGVGLGILLGTYRIINGDNIVWYILIGYVVVVVMTFFSPRTIIPIAYDSGGVTTSTVTVPIVAALGIGLASAIPGRDPLIDGFGLIAFASLFPMIAVLGYGIAEKGNVMRHERKIKNLEKKTSERIGEHLKIHDHQDTKEHVPLHPSGVKKKIITISGDEGAGVSSVSKKVAERLRYQHFSSGKLFREIAERHDMDLTQLSHVAEHDTAIDHELDALIQELGEKNNKLVIDSRLAYHWIHGSFKVYLKISSEEGARRIYNDIRKEKRVGEKEKTVEEAQVIHQEIEASRKKRYQNLYGIDITNLKPFNLVIDTEEQDVDDVVEAILNAYEVWTDKK